MLASWQRDAFQALGPPERRGIPLGAASISKVKMTKGRVYLVGAGPGDPDLLTVKAFRLLRTADIVFHDDLVSPQILGLIPCGTHVESVGKRCGQASVTQQQIHALLINAAREGWEVVRLKSGDPLVFGRAGEEMEALRQAGIEFEVVPGITAAFGAAAQARIPLTDRRRASKVLFLSNHHCSGKALPDWKNVISNDATVVIYMPGADYGSLANRLCASGLEPQTACLVVSDASSAQQQIHPATLAKLPKLPCLPAPVLLIIGAVVEDYSSKEARPNAIECLGTPPMAVYYETEEAPFGTRANGRRIVTRVPQRRACTERDGQRKFWSDFLGLARFGASFENRRIDTSWNTFEQRFIRPGAFSERVQSLP